MRHRITISLLGLALLAGAWFFFTDTPPRPAALPPGRNTNQPISLKPVEPAPAAPDTNDVNELLSRIASSDPVIRASTAVALGRIRTQPDLVVPDLQKLVYDDTPAVRAAAATALGEFGPDAIDAVVDLLEAACETNAAVSRAAGLAVLRLGEPHANQTLLDRLADTGTNALPVLCAALDHPAADIRRRALHALQRIDPILFPPPAEKTPSESEEEQLIIAARTAAEKFTRP